MFHLLRLNTASAVLISAVLQWVSESQGIRDDRNMNELFSMLKQYWFLATAHFLFSESAATFRAVTAGIIGGKTWSYLSLAYGIPFVNLGITLYLHGDNYGTDPRAFIGWLNETKSTFFYGILPCVTISVILVLIILINTATPQTRKDSVMEQLATQAYGLSVVVFLHAITWVFAYPAFNHFPDYDLANFYPIFAILDAWTGAFVFCLLGLSSRKFRGAMFGQARLSVSKMFF